MQYNGISTVNLTLTLKGSLVLQLWAAIVSHLSYVKEAGLDTPFVWRIYVVQCSWQPMKVGERLRLKYHHCLHGYSGHIGAAVKFG